MSQSDLARWLRQEHERTSGLARSLRETTGALPGVVSRDWLDGLKKLFEQFRAHMVQRLALEEQDGYLKPVLDARPGLAGEVDALRAEHHQFVELLQSLYDSLQALAPDQKVLLRDWVGRLDGLLARIDEHDRKENHLVLSVMTLDIGAGD